MTDSQNDGRRTKTRDRVADLAKQGVDARLIAIRLGISTQMVYRHLKKLEKEAAS